jgi:hypothetical protein
MLKPMPFYFGGEPPGAGVLLNNAKAGNVY